MAEPMLGSRTPGKALPPESSSEYGEKLTAMCSSLDRDALEKSQRFIQEPPPAKQAFEEKYAEFFWLTGRLRNEGMLPQDAAGLAANIICSLPTNQGD